MKNTCRFELIIADLTKKDRLLAVNPEINIGLDRTLQQIGTWLQASIVPVCSHVLMFLLLLFIRELFLSNGYSFLLLNSVVLSLYC